MSPSTPKTPIQFAQELKEQIALDQVISDYVPLKRVGTSFKGLCPFHKEKTPSFHVHPERGFYHCFGCGVHGDVIKFIQEIEKIDFMLALEALAKRAGVPMPEFHHDGAQTDEQERRRALLREICTWAEGFFIEQLRHHPRGSIARDYLRGRGLSDEQIGHYRLGYAPDGYEALLAAADRRGWKPETLAEAGLASRRDTGGFIDRFVDRVMFPIADRMGQVVAFAGRLLADRERAAKYINSVETPIFRKSQILYGMDRAREAIKQTGQVILIEGYMDWIALDRHGIGNALASMGTALTEEQARLIRRMSGQVILLYDGDAAGRKAMFRATELLVRQGLEVKAAALPTEHDPDSFLEAEGTQAMRDLLSGAPASLDYFIGEVAAASDLSRPESKAEAVSRLAPLLLAIEEPSLREGYLARAAGRLGLRLETLEASLKRRRRQAMPERAEEEDEPSRESQATAASRSEQNLLYVLLQMQDRWATLPPIDPSWVHDEQLRLLFEKFYDVMRDVREGGDPPSDPFDLCDNETQRHLLSRVLLLPMERFGGELADFSQMLHEGMKLQILKLQRQWVQRRKRELTQDLQMILGQTPLGAGQLAAIDALSRENLRNGEQFFERFRGGQANI